jgi:hypothetical protein
MVFRVFDLSVAAIDPCKQGSLLGLIDHHLLDHYAVWRDRLEGLLASTGQVKRRDLSFLGDDLVALKE